MSKSKVQRNTATIAAQNSEKLIKNHYVHSYFKNFQAVINKEGLSFSFSEEKILRSILNNFISLKKKELLQFSNSMGYNNDYKTLINDLNGGLKEAKNSTEVNKKINTLIKKELNSFFNNSDWDTIIYQNFSSFIDNILNNPQSLNIPNERVTYFTSEAEKYESGKKNFSKNEINELRRAFINDLENSDPRLAKVIQTVLYSSGDSDGYFAALIGVKKFSGRSKKVTKIPSKSSLKNVCLKNLGLDGDKGSNIIKNRVLTLFQDSLALQNFSQVISQEFKGKDIKVKSNRKSKSNLSSLTFSFTLPDDSIVSSFGIAVKDFNQKKNGLNSFSFKVKDLTLQELKTTIEKSGISSLTAVIDKVYYLILNTQLFATGGTKVDTGNKNNNNQYEILSQNQEVKNYLNKYFSALVGFWFGQSIIEDENFNSANKLMSVGLVYSPTDNKLVPAYEILESIIKDFKKESSQNSVKVSFTGIRTQQDAKNLYAKKMQSVPKNYKGKIKYPDSLINVGGSFGKDYEKSIKLKIVANFLENLLK